MVLLSEFGLFKEFGLFISVIRRGVRQLSRVTVVHLLSAVQISLDSLRIALLLLPLGE
jgi:hypothetical protein